MTELSKPSQLLLKSVNQLFDFQFYIPSYQRGYRWTETEVTQLLQDIWQFTMRDGKLTGEFYCLQPIVVIEKKVDNIVKWEVIDGQQRLTTLYLILKKLQNQIDSSKKNIKEICYETRSDSWNFLQEVENKNEEEAKQNVDYWHIWNAYKTILKWFQDKADNSGNATPSAFIAPSVLNDTKVIWFEVSKEENNNHYDIFTRLNSGKIPLTNAELVKALFLQKSNFADEKVTLKQIQIASEWDMIEKTLQDDAFWYFIYNPTNPLKYDNRIEYIFDLMKNRTRESEFYHTYNEFYKEFSISENKSNNKPDIDKIWLSIKQYFLNFEEWFKDYVLFHYVGFLIDCGKPIYQLKEAKEGNIEKNILPKSKIEFKNYLIEEIKENQVKFHIDSLDYPKDKHKIRKVLLLFNIQTVLETQKSDMRFPFHKYKAEDWDIEHIRSQNDQNETGKITNQDEWADDIHDFFVGSTDRIEIQKFVDKSETLPKIKEICKALLDYQNEIDKNQKQQNFNAVYEKVSDYFNESDNESEKQSNKLDNINTISNLALLDATTNRSYGNAFFPIKRKRIIENDKNGIFVPICTKNLFLKYYSKKLGEVMYWNNDDANDYLQAIKETLSDFLPNENFNAIDAIIEQTKEE